MKVLLINGSPHEKGCTHAALREAAQALEAEGVGTEIFHVGKAPIRGCAACYRCKKNKVGRCAFDDDTVNTAIEKAAGVQGFIFGSPVHFAAATGAITSFLDRFFIAGRPFVEYKPGAAVVSCRRGGATAAFDQLNKYFMISNMPVVSSQYWNMVHGNSPQEVAQDLEGLQTMRTLGRNMAWLLKSIEAGKKAGIALPEKEELQSTNFIR